MRYSYRVGGEFVEVVCRLARRGAVLAALTTAACSAPSDSDEAVSQSTEPLTSSCTSRTIRVADLRADYRDIWAGRETPETGKQAEPDATAAVDFTTTVDPARVQATFTPTIADGTCGAAVAATVGGSVIAADTWGKLTSNSTRPLTPAPYNLFVLENVSGIPSVAGAIAAGGDISLSSFSVNGTAGQPVGLMAGGRVVLANGSVRGDVTYGVASTIPQSVSVSGTTSSRPFVVSTAWPQLESLSRILAGEPATGTTQTNGSELVLSGSKSGRNTFLVSAGALAQASSVRISVPSGAGALVNVTGASVTLENKSITLQGVTASTLLWNLPEASLLKVASIGLSGSVLAPNARVSFESGSITGTVAARSFASPGSGSLAVAPLNGNVLFGSTAPSSVAISASQPLVRGCEYELVISSTSPLTSGGNCLTAPVRVRFRVAPGPSTPAARELVSATSDAFGLRRFEARSGINTPVSDVFRRYQSGIGALPSDLVPTGYTIPSSTTPGETFIAYRQLHLGYPVAGYGYLVSVAAGIFRDANGKVVTGLPAAPPSPVSGSAALTTALQFLNITTPPWVSNPTANRPPLQTLAWVAKRPNATGAEFVLVWEFRFAGTGLVEPGGMQVDATTNRVLNTDPGSVRQAPLAPLAPLDPAATFAGRHTPNDVNTMFGNGLKTIDVPVYTQPTGAIVTTLATNPAATPGVIETVIQPEPSGGPSTTLVRVTDPTPTTPWTATEPLEQIMGTIQWGLVSSRNYLATLDFRMVPGATPWASVDGLNQQKLVARWRDFGATEGNAIYRDSLWTPDTTIIDFINGPPAPPTTPFFIAHEFYHAVLSNMRRSRILEQLKGRYESGSIDEGLADLFALGATHYHLGEGPDWYCSKEGTLCCGCTPDDRDLSNPLRTNKPIFYQGTNFTVFGNVTTACTQANDFCSAHGNSTVISYWGYLLGFGSSRSSASNPCGLTIAPLDPDPDVAMKRLLNLNFLTGATVLGPTGFPNEPSFADFRDASIRVARSQALRSEVPSDTPRKLELAWYAVGLGPEFLSESVTFLPTDGEIVNPPDESVSVSPWLDFKWPVNGDGQQATSWDFQIADGPFATSTRLDKRDITDTIVENGVTMATLGVALPFNSDKRFYWRVRPHSNDAWDKSCYPVHSFRGTTTPGTVQNLEPWVVILPDGSVQPGNASFRWDEVEGAASYRVFIATHQTNCQGGPGVIELETLINQAHVTGIQPEERYFISVLPIGPPNFSGIQSPGTCTTTTFDTGPLGPPSLNVPVDTALYEYHGVTRPTWVWGSFDGPSQYRLQLYDIDQFGNCASNGTPNITHTVASTCTDGNSFCQMTVAENFLLVPRNPSGYCWNIVSIAQNNRESIPSETRKLFYGHLSIRKNSPGIQLAFTTNGVPAPIPGDSYGKPVTFNWVPEFDAFSYVIKVAPWPWSQFIPLDPENCAFVQNNATGKPVNPFPVTLGCNEGSVGATYYQSFTGNTGTTNTGMIDGNVASKGRYCWTMWPELDGPRQPYVDINPIFCYTSGPAEPDIVIDNPPSQTSFSSAPITGRITIDYVPDMQLEVTGNPAADFQFSYDDCQPDERTALFDDRYDCVIEFEAKSHEATDYSIRVRTWNGDSHPPRMDGTPVHDKVEPFKTIACGGRNEACCGSTCDTTTLTCQAGKCVDCGQRNQPCCGARCDAASLACEAGKCVDCGQLNQACCANNACSATTLACKGGKCQTCGQSGGPCCTSGDQCVRLQCPSGDCRINPITLSCQNSSCASCGKPMEPCCPVGGVIAQPDVCAASGVVRNDAGTGVAASNCVSGRCDPCGQPGQPCCNGNLSSNGTLCTAGSTCTNGRCSGVTTGEACNSMVHDGGDTAETHVIQLGKTSGTVSLFINTFGIPDRLRVFYQGAQIADTTCLATSGRSGCSPFGCCDGEWCEMPITYSGSSSQMTVEVIPNCEGGTGTDWSFALSCPP